MSKYKSKIYLDTSVISVYDDPRIPQRQAQTQEFWKTLKDFRVYISEITINEINNIPNSKKRKRLLSLSKNFFLLHPTEEAEKLAQEYVRKKIIPKRYIDDAIHLAIATVNRLDILVSWNCKHLINLKTKREANKINLAKGYKEIELVEPPMVKL
ncbi:type II toxin-antitoxin system VapC family toxin [Patescibacteria group bacterium AH-259-L07]|nr:type II toxin-antitoxin system VapC family toxin [Patescibacteria group bacterium AH-259-L07]